MRLERWLRASLLLVLVGCAVACLVLSRRWPLVGDASLMHYVVFLMSHGLAPYKDIVEVNLPGSFLSEAAAMGLFGWGAVGWRLYDLTLMLILAVAGIAIAGRKNWIGGAVAGGLFLVIHMQDGLAQAGQRDLLIAVLLVAAYPALFASQKGSRRHLSITLFGLLIGMTVVIKPLLLPLGLILIVISARFAQSQGRLRGVLHAACGVLGLSIPAAGVLAWLWSRGAVVAFFDALTGLIPFHASLGRKPIAYLLAHCASPMLPLLALWLVLVMWRRRRPALEHLELMIGAAIALVAYLSQGKGYPYQRYPFLALMLLLICTECVECLPVKGAVRWVAVLGLGYGCLVMAPLAVWRVQSFRPDRPFAEALAAGLAKAGAGNGEVQCLDTFGGCVNTLYDLRIVQSTGFLYDCYLFVPGSDASVRQYRERFWAAYERARPRILVMTDQYCFEANRFSKVKNWPLLEHEIGQSYDQVENWRSARSQRWWSRTEEPAEFRIYLRK